MRARQKVSKAGVELIARFEGLRRRAARLPDGRWTIGYGHTLSAREGAEVSDADAEALLHFDMLPITEAVNSLVYTPLTQNQFDALVAFAYNVGVEAFRDSDVLKRINEGRLTEAACAFDLWRKAAVGGDPIILDALIRRRAAEKALFLTPAEGFVPTPTALVRPMVDESLAPALPQQRPVEIETPMEGETAEVRVVDLPLAPDQLDEAIELSESEGESPESQPQDSEPVEAQYSDAIPVETPEELEIQALEASEPGVEAVVDETTVRIEPDAGAPENASATLEAVEAPAVEDTRENAVVEVEAEPAEPFPQAVEPQPVEPADPEALEAASPFPSSPEEPAAEAVALAAGAQRIYAPEPGAAAPEDAPVNDLQAGSSVPAALPPPEVSTLPVDEPAVTAGTEAPASVWTLTPPPEVADRDADGEPEPAPAVRYEIDELQSPLFEEQSAAEQAVGGRVVRHEELDPEDGGPDRPATGIFALLGVIGLAAIGGALAAFFKARAGAGDDGLTVIAWVLALIGAACAGTAVYFLLKRLGGVED